MQSTDILAKEHRLLARLARCLESRLDDARDTNQLDGVATLEALTIFERFGDCSHQDKEEQHLFPRLRARAARRADRFSALVAGHAEERRRFQEMRLHLEGACYGEAICLDLFMGHARRYLDLHRKHMAWENLLLLPLAERVLTLEDDQRIVAGFRRVDACGLQPADVNRRIAKLCQHCGVVQRADETSFEVFC